MLQLRQSDNRSDDTEAVMEYIGLPKKLARQLKAEGTELREENAFKDEMMR